ncbi:MAG: hypothetical protein PHG96_14160, partial [Kiritimatiellae bacterium]|nr:hypothetical protein [Kiritimatiellia bacterium]
MAPEWAAARFPPRFTVRVPRFRPDLPAARVKDKADGISALALLKVRKQAAYLLYAKAGQEVVVTGRQTQVGKSVFCSKPQVIRSPAGKTFHKSAFSGFNQDLEMKFKADPDGQEVWRKDTITVMERFTTDKDQGLKSGLWQVCFARPGKGVFEDFHVDVLGIPGYLFLSPDRYWTF